jgi:hypothetical protein
MLRESAPGPMKELSHRDPRQNNGPALAGVCCCMLLVVLAHDIGVKHPLFWLALAFSIALIVMLVRRLGGFTEVWGADDGLIIVKHDEFEKIPWKDVEAVWNHYSPVCAVRFRRDTPFGRVLSFPIAPAQRLFGFEHPDAVWIRQHIEAASPSEARAGIGTPDDAAWQPSKTTGQRLGLAATAAFLALTGAVIIRGGLAQPSTATVTGSGQILGCEERSGARVHWIMVHIAGLAEPLAFHDLDYLPYVQEACSARAVVSWAAVLGSDGQPYVVAFERAGVRGGLTEEAYRSSKRSGGVFLIALGVAALVISFGCAARAFESARKAETRPVT